jgi:hypothetical protein
MQGQGVFRGFRHPAGRGRPTPWPDWRQCSTKPRRQRPSVGRRLSPGVARSAREGMLRRWVPPPVKASRVPASRGVLVLRRQATSCIPSVSSHTFRGSGAARSSSVVARTTAAHNRRDVSTW